MGNPEALSTQDEKKVRKIQRDNKEWAIQRHCQHWVHKTQDEINVIENRRAIKNRQSRDIANIGYERHRTK